MSAALLFTCFGCLNAWDGSLESASVMAFVEGLGFLGKCCKPMWSSLNDFRLTVVLLERVYPYSDVFCTCFA